MTATCEKLFLNDSLALAFEATILGQATYRDQPSLLLDRSAFYGESGGQLGDRGALHIGDETIAIVDTQYDDQGRHHHLAEELPAGLAAGQTVRGVVDFDHRRDMMSQHTGQHLLSAICFEELGAETVSARLGAKVSTLDLEIEEITPELRQRILDRAHASILADKPVRPLYPTPDELEAMNLRRLPKVSSGIRILEIEGLDLTPCGGTHCQRTGQIGPIVITGTERVRNTTRLLFLAGTRAIAHQQSRDAMLEALGQELGCGSVGVAEAVTAMRADLAERSQKMGRLRTELNAMLCDRIWSEHPATDQDYTPVVAIREHDDLSDARALAQALARRPDVVALTAAPDEKSGGWRIVLARGEAADFHCGKWFRGPGAALGARGGGRPERAEGVLPPGADPQKLEL